MIESVTTSIKADSEKPEHEKKGAKDLDDEIVDELKAEKENK